MPGGCAETGLFCRGCARVVRVEGTVVTRWLSPTSNTHVVCAAPVVSPATSVAYFAMFACDVAHHQANTVRDCHSFLVGTVGYQKYHS